MAATVPTATRSVKEYRTSIGHQSITDITRRAQSLKGTRILHLSAAPSRAELSSTLSTLTSMLQAIGLDAEWRVVRNRPEHIHLDQTLQRALRGHFVRWTAEMAELWHNHCDDLLDIPMQDYDFIVVHDAELAGIIGSTAQLDRANRAKWIWHCHSDISDTQPDVWNFLMRHTLRYDRRIVSTLESVCSTQHDSYDTVPPIVDPLNLRNRDLPPRFVDSVLRHYGLNPTRPMILSVLQDNPSLRNISRMIDAFEAAKDQMPGIYLLLLASEDADENQLARYSEYVEHNAHACKDVYLMPMPSGIGQIGINAFQRSATAVIESSQDEALTTSILEAMWKERPVVVGEETAARLGIVHGVNGCIARSAKELANQIVRLAESRLIATTIGRAASEHVRGNFLITKLLDAYIRMLQELMPSREVVTKSCLVATI